MNTSMVQAKSSKDDQVIDKENLGGRVEKPVEAVQGRAAINKDNAVKEIVVQPVREVRAQDGTLLPLVKHVTPKGNISYLLNLMDTDGMSLSASELRKQIRERDGLSGNALTKAVNSILATKEDRIRYVQSLVIGSLDYNQFKLVRGRMNKNLNAINLGFRKLSEVSESERTSAQLLAEENRKLKAKIAELEAKKV